ncbi:transcriptional regulator [Pantoea stewartii]|uniref:transcriptional regulator n=1 Tax=Pantoea stewartii TaxID=66269 RepID=UPI0023F75C58|nr:transcriptional regulator [Pantoea stewartii]MDF7788019.1 transcriptional regulator [Pantoea stewartii]
MVNQMLRRPVTVRNNVRDLRADTGMTQACAAERFDISLRVWQMKEAENNPSSLSQGEYEFLLLLAGQHPHFHIKEPGNKP